MPKEKKRQERIELADRGRETLEREGFNWNRPPRTPEDKSRFRERFGNELPVSLAILDCFENSGDPDSAADILTLEERTDDKRLLKEIRATLHRLKQKGIKFPEREGHTFEPVRGEPEVDAFLGPIDGGGQRIACLFKPIPGMGTLMIQSLVHEERGMLKMAGGVLPKKEIRRVQAELRERLRTVPVNWKRVDAILYDAYRKARDAGDSELGEYPKLREAFASAEPEPPWSPLAELATEHQPRGDIPDESTAHLLEEPELSDWILPESETSNSAEELERVRESPLILNRYQQQDRIQETIQNAAGRLLEGPLRDIYKRRLEEMAEYFHRQSRLPQTDQALYAALQLQEWTPERNPPAFFVALLRKSLAVKMETEERRKKEEVSLIVRP